MEGLSSQVTRMLSDIIRTFCFRINRDTAIHGLDGLRCYAALFVILSHSKLGSPGWGATGVWLFFVLSGMLLTPSLVRAIRSKSTTRQITREILAYLARRVFRIVPAFLFVVAVFCAVIWKPQASWFNYKIFWQHLTFQIGMWHFWTTKTEMLLYLVLPAIVGVLAFLRGWRLALALALALVGTYLATEHWKFITIRIGRTSYLQVFATPFLIGVALAFITRMISDRVRKLCFWLGAIGLIALSSDIAPIITLRELIGIQGANLPWRLPILVYPFAALTVFGATGNKSLILNNRVAQTVGVVGFSVYLWHFLILHLLETYLIDDPGLRFFASLPLTLFVSVLTYHLIEVPGQRLGGRIERSILARKAPTETRENIGGPSLIPQ